MAYREITEPTLDRFSAQVKNFEFDLDASLEHIAHWLPAQGPIKDFIHHNTLHAVQHHPFHEGIAIAAKVFGARSYLPLEDYQGMYHAGRIKPHAIDWAIEHSGCTKTKQDQLRETLFEQDHTGHYPPVSLTNHGIRNAWLTQHEVDLNALVQPILFRLLGNFLDQGISRWSLPKDGEHFWDCIVRLTKNSLLPLYPFDEPVVNQLLTETLDEVINACLKKIVGDEQLYEQYLLEVLLAHPGWSGMVHVIEQNPKSLLARREISLKEMLAVELAIELAFLHKKKGLNFSSIAMMPTTNGTPLLKEGGFKPVIPLRLRVWHEAMEWSLHSELLRALKPKSPATAEPLTKPLPEVQALFCIDDRECSIRRHLEEVNPAIETLGAAGFLVSIFFIRAWMMLIRLLNAPTLLFPSI